MGIGYNPRIVTDGLVLCLDAANVKSYPGILGSELVTNSIITQIDGTTFNVFRDATQAFNLTLCNVEAGKTYYVDYLITSYTGTVGATFRISNSSGNLTPTIVINAAGRFNRKFTASVSGSLTINGDNAGTDFLVDYVSVREVLSGTGLTCFDLSGNLNNGTLTNGVTYSANNSGVFSFSSASSQYVTVSDSASLTLTTATIETWVKFSTLGTRIIFCGKGDGASNPTTEYWVEKTSANKFSVYFSISTSASNHLLNDTSVVANTWYHIVGTFDGSNVRGYVNGVQDSSVGSLSGNIVDTSINYSVGRLGTYNTQYHNGSIAVNKIYNRALSLSEVKQNFNALRGRFGI